MADLPASLLTEADLTPTPAPRPAANTLPPSFLTEDDLGELLAPSGPSQVQPTAPSPAPMPGPSGAPIGMDEMGNPFAGGGESARAAAADVGKGIAESPMQILRGLGQAANATSGAAFDAANWLNTHVMDLGQVSYDRHGSWNPRNWTVGYQQGMPAANNLLIPDAAIPDHAASTTGGLVEGVTQFTAGMIGAGKFLRAFGFGRGAVSAVGGAALRTAEGGITMATAFDPHEARLADLVQSYPALQNPVTEFLATHDDDGPGMARVRAGLEGLGLGAATEGLLTSLRAMRSLQRGDHARAVDELAPPPTARVNAAGEIEMPEVLVEAPGKPPGAPGEAPATPAAGEAARPAREAPAAQGELPLGEGGPAADSPRASVEANPGATVNGNPGATASPAPQARKLIEMTPDELRAAVQQRITEQAYRGEEMVSGIRTDLIENGDDLKSILDSLRVVYQEEMGKAIGGTPTGVSGEAPVRTLADVAKNATRLADMIGDNPQLLMQRMSNTHGNLLHLDAETRLYADFLATVGDKLHRMAEAVSDPLGRNLMGFANRGELMVQFAKHYELMANTQAMFKGIQTNIARSLGAFRLGAKVSPELMAAIANPDDLFQGGVTNMERLARRIVASGGSTEAVAKATRPGFVARFLGAVNEYWINSVLSGPKTHVANMAGNLVSTAILPAERMLSGAFNLMNPAGRQEFFEGGLHYVGMMLSLRDATTLAARAFRLNDAVLDAAGNSAAELGGPAISAAAIGARDGTISSVIANGLGHIVRIPSRLLTTEDEFFKQLVYRGAVRAQAMREAFQAGMWNDATNPTAFGDHIARRLDEAATATGTAANPGALQLAQYATFQNGLGAQTNTGLKTIGETVQGIASNHPALKIVLPFVRTPTNMVRYLWDRTPGMNLARRQFYNDISGANGPEAQTRAAARNMTGGILWATAIGFVLDGTVTGAGPQDKSAQAALRASGWQPYSVKVNNSDGTVSYRAIERMNPYAAFFTLAADFAEVAAAHPEKEVSDTAMALVAALARNLENQTYVSGLVRATAALGQPDRRGEGFAQGIAGGFVPSVMRQALMNDDLMREARGIVDAMRARTPGFSQQLDPRRNIMGEPVHTTPTWGPEWASPISQTTRPGGAQPVSPEWRTTVNPRVDDELARLAYNHADGFNPPPTAYGPMKLDQLRSTVTGKSVYDRWMELTGTVEVGGMNLRQRLADTIGQDYYRRTLTDGDTIHGGSRLEVMQKWIGHYREVAREALGKEQPELAAAFMDVKRMQGMSRYQHLQQ